MKILRFSRSVESAHLLLECYVSALQQLGQQQGVLIVHIVITGAVDQQEIMSPEFIQIVECITNAIIRKIVSFYGQAHVAFRIYGI